MEGLSRTALRCSSLTLALLGTACTHGDPFSVDDYRTQVPFHDTDPARLTYSEYADLDPAWLPDGSGVLYSYTHTDSPERDRCLGVLPRTGGQRVREICRRTLADRDTIDGLGLPAVSAGGRLAFRRSAASLSGTLPEHTELVAGTLVDPFGGPILRRLPFTGPDGRFYVDLSQPQWTGESGLVFVGQVEEIVSPCPGCDPFVVRRNAGIIHLLADGSGTVSPLPGTETVTSLAAGSDRSLLAPYIPFVVSAAGGRILAQSGAGLHVIDPEAGTVTDVAAAGLTNPVLHPDGSLIVGVRFDPDTFDSDLWRLTLP
ncbi:MAG: hypothetical protein ACM357_09250 [Gemmatimonadota bacterium]